MALKLANNAVSKLAGTLATGGTSLALTPGDGAKFPALGAGDWFPLTVIKSDGTFEVMRCTARATDTLTVTRAQEGTAALAFAAGDRVELRFTALAAFSLPYLPLSGGGSVTGPVSIDAGEGAATLLLPAATAGVEIGSTVKAGTPFIDFHSSGNNIDYDARIQAFGGSAANGQGGLNLYAAGGVFAIGGGFCLNNGQYYSGKLINGSIARLMGVESLANHVDIVNAGGAKVRFINQAYSAELGSFDNAGNFVAAGNLSGYSDRRLKSNIKRIKGAMAKVRELVGVTFTRRRSKDKTRHMGFIAQDVEKVVPEVVRTDEKGVKMIAYPNLTALLAEALKELDDRVAVLEEARQ
ncbi:tail fiber protein 2 [Burkholderia phage CSP3]|nr:tail fiber protein 2 [Burkholderia phage CSP3]